MGRSDERASIAEAFREYGEATFGDEPTYSEICNEIAQAPHAIDLLLAHEPDARQPNLILAAVHYLLLGGHEHDLGERWGQPSSSNSHAATITLFDDFVGQHRGQVDRLLATKRTQTNEVGRSAVLAMMLDDAHRRTNKPLAWIDLGASAGLNLNLDRYRISYESDTESWSLGPAEAELNLRCRLEPGSIRPPSAHTPIGWRLGIDKNVVDASDDAQARWLQACVWPSDRSRRETLNRALDIARRYPPPLMQADAAYGIAQAIEQAPSDLTLVVTTTWVWYYLPEDVRSAILASFQSCGRPVFWYSLEALGVVVELGHEPLDVGRSVMGRTVFGSSMDALTGVRLGAAHPHGRWIDWPSTSA